MFQTAIILKVLCHFFYLLHCVAIFSDMQRNPIRSMALLMHSTVLIIIYCVMTNKLDWIECAWVRSNISIFYHIIQGKSNYGS